MVSTRCWTCAGGRRRTDGRTINEANEARMEREEMAPRPDSAAFYALLPGFSADSR